MDYVKSYSTEIGLLLALIAVFIATLQFLYQKRSFVDNSRTIKKAFIGADKYLIEKTGEVIEEIWLIRFTNAGFVPSAVESARFEIYVDHEWKGWDLVDVVGADKEFQIAMPLRIDPAASIEIKFKFNGKRSVMVREHRVVFVQKFLREKKEIRTEVSVGQNSIAFMDEGAER